METVNYRHNILNVGSVDAFLNVKGEYNNGIRDVYFIRAVGEPQNIHSLIEDTDRQMDKEAANNKLKYVRISALPKLLKIEDSEYYQGIYSKWESGSIGAFRNFLLNETVKNTFLQALRRISDDYKKFGKNTSYSIIKNFIIKLLYWFDESMSEILKDWNENSLIKVIADNVTKEQEYLFYLFLTFIGCDVLLIQNRGDIEIASGLLGYSKKFMLGSYGNSDIKPYTSQNPTMSVNKEDFSSTTINTVISKKVVIPPRPQKNKKAQEALVNNMPSSHMPPVATAKQASNEKRELSFEELAKLASFVVLIAIHDAKGEVIGTGSGIMIGKDGFILTNHHVAAGGRFYSVRVEEEDKVYSTNELIKYNSSTDLAVLRIKRQLKPIPIYRGEKALVRGQKVVAIGSPLGLFNSVSDGIISGFRNIDNVDMIQFTAPISHGSSGGALLNMYGEVIGISTAGIDRGQNINLAVGYENIKLFTAGFTS